MISGLSAYAARGGGDHGAGMMRSHRNIVNHCLLNEEKQKTTNYTIIIRTIIRSL